MEFRCSPYIPLIFVGILGILICCSLPSSAQSQCQLEVNYSVQKAGNSYSISLTSDAPASSVKVQLYDLFQGKVIAEKEVHNLGVDARVVFRDIEPSKYAVFVRVDGCDRATTLGGISGISIGVRD